MQVAKPRFLAIASMALTTLLVLVPLAESTPYFFTPNSPEHIKPVLAYLQQHRQPGDVTYVFQKGQYPFLYYADRYGYKPEEYILGINDVHEMDKEQELQMYREDVDRLKGNPRVWILVSDTRIRDRTKFVLAHLQTIGKRLEVYKSSVPSSFVELYNLR
ncbi:hypothetical protein HC928_09550 [bacterium]|nr:hypothetical protein [bacterium]